MAVNKVIIDGVTKIDLTSDTVTPDTLIQGYTAHNASGNQITGTASGGTVDYFAVVDGKVCAVYEVEENT